MESPKLICIMGARPNFVKMAAIVRALKQFDSKLNLVLVHTGQHYDLAMADSFFQFLDIPSPNYELKVGSGSHSWQTAEIMLRFEKVMEQEKPTAVLVVGDVNSTIACSLVASKMQVPIVHVEAGLRSFDRTMPEEINRVLTDQLASLHFTTEMSAKKNLLQEGIHQNGIYFVGNVMIDTLNCFKDKAKPYQASLKLIGLENVDAFGLMTLHRPSNVDCLSTLQRIIETVLDLSHEVPIIFPSHPRTRIQLEQLNIDWSKGPNFKLIEPLDYLTMLGLVQHAKFILTDSGGLQEETTALGVPCLTLRYNTERPVTLTHGTNQIVGTEAKAIKQKVIRILSEEKAIMQKVPPLWDGHAAERIAQILVPWLYQAFMPKHKHISKEAV